MAPEFSSALEIECLAVAKRFGRQWIIRDFSAGFRAGKVYGIAGRNGSGKSTLVRLLAGQLGPSRGRIVRTLGSEQIIEDDFYRLVSWTGPYSEVVEEMTIEEFLNFHFSLKKILPGLRAADVLKRTELSPFAKRRLFDCSSGMRQRVLLASALYAATPLLLLDEPTLTLDAVATTWFADELARVKAGRLTVIASNDAGDLALCDQVTTLTTDK